MTIESAPYLRYRSLYMLWMAASATTLTAIFVLVIIRLPDLSPSRLIPWLTLWVFTVIVPALASFRLHRRCGELVRAAGSVPADVLRDLAQLRWTFLIQGSMAALAGLTVFLERT